MASIKFKEELLEAIEMYQQLHREAKQQGNIESQNNCQRELNRLFLTLSQADHIMRNAR